VLIPSAVVIFWMPMVDDNLRNISRPEFFSIIPDGPDVHFRGTVINPLLGHINFRERRPSPNEFRPPEDDAYLFYP